MDLKKVAEEYRSWCQEDISEATLTMISRLSEGFQFQKVELDYEEGSYFHLKVILAKTENGEEVSEAFSSDNIYDMVFLRKFWKLT